MTRSRSLFALLLAVFAFGLTPPAAAQLLNNASIKGSYNFRYLGVLTSPNDVPVSYSGTLVSDGKSDSSGSGNVTVTGQGAGATLGPSANNIYGVYSSGLMYMNNPFDATGGTFFFGGVSNGSLILSATDSFY